MGRKLTEEQKKNISNGRKKWLSENPEKHPWKRNDKFKSIPCETVKGFLTEKDIKFQPEYDPVIQDRYFSVDIAFPDRMIIWEINGNQHYERDGTLKPYYQERHDLLVSNGWTVYEIPYTYCFKQEKLEELLNLSMNSETKVEFEYFNYVPKNSIWGKKDLCSECGDEKLEISKFCRKCKKRPQSDKWPSVEEMRELVWQMPSSEIAKNIGFSDTAIVKFCKRHEIKKPPLGYWAKVKAGKII